MKQFIVLNILTKRLYIYCILIWIKINYAMKQNEIWSRLLMRPAGDALQFQRRAEYLWCGTTMQIIRQVADENSRDSLLKRLHISLL